MLSTKLIPHNDPNENALIENDTKVKKKRKFFTDLTVLQSKYNVYV